MIFSAVARDKVDYVIDDLQELRESYRDTIPFGSRIFVMGLEKMV